MHVLQALPLAVLAAALGLAAPASAADLVEAWEAAARSDREHAVARAARLAAQPRLDQAAALWRPTVGVQASTGLGLSETTARGAQFSAPGMGSSSGVSFNTSVHAGLSGRVALQAVQPLYNPLRRTQQQQLSRSVELAELEWLAAQQQLMLRTAERWFELTLAQEQVRVLQQRLTAVERATTEAQDRFQLGALAVTDTHEARAQQAGLRAQLLAAQSAAQLLRDTLADSTGLAATALAPRLPSAMPVTVPDRPLAQWQAEADAGNPGLRVQQIAAELARLEVARHSREASASVDLVAQAAHERLYGRGDFGSASSMGTQGLVGVQFSMPLSTGGWRSAKAEESLRLAQKADAEVERARLQVAQQVRAVWTQLGVGAQRAQALAQGVAAATARRDATQTGVQVGDRTTQNLLDAEADLAAAQLALSQARVAWQLDRIRLAALAGRLDGATLRAADAP